MTNCSIGQDIYFYLNHPIKWIRLTGVVVAIDDIAGRTIFTIDDSSGVNIEATCSLPAKDSLIGLSDDRKVTAKECETQECKSNELAGPNEHIITNIDVGSVVKIRGKIGIFRGRKQINLTGPKGITLLAETNEEVKCWNDVMEFKRTVLVQPWVVTGDEEKRCREEQDREMLWRKQEAERKRGKQIRKQIKEKSQGLQKEIKRHSEHKGTHGNEDAHITNGLRRVSRRAEGRVSDVTDHTTRMSQPSIAARKLLLGEYDALGF